MTLDAAAGRRWAALAGRWGAPARDVAVAEADLSRRYAEPHRRYHTMEHIAEVLAALDALVGSVPPDLRTAVELAGWLHDVVYDPHAAPGRSEEASAGYAEHLLEHLGAGPAVRADTSRLIRGTAAHTPAPGDAAAAALCDADLWILAAPRERYARYAADVRVEYGFLADDAWRAGRAAVLSRLASRVRLYVVARSWERTARANLAWELAELAT